MNPRTRKPFSNSQFDREFDAAFKRGQRLAISWFVFVVVVWLAILSGVAFVVFKVLQHFGIL